MSALPITPETTETTLIAAEALRLFHAGVLTFPASGEVKHPNRVTHWAPAHYPPDGWPSLAEHIRIFQQFDITRLFVVAGKRSGNVATLDFDAEGYFDQWGKLIPDDLYDRLYLERSQRSGGVHAVVRVAGPTPCCVPAKDPDGKLRIEVRGEGQGFVAAPSMGYQRLSGDLADLPVLTADEYQILLDAAATFNEYAPPPPKEEKPRTVRSADADERPGDRYNRESGQSEVLTVFQQHGWKIGARGGGNVSITHPNATTKTSGNVNADGVTCIFSTNTPFEASVTDDGKGHAPFHVYATLEHGGDYQAAGKALSALYDPQSKRRVKAHNGTVDAETGDISPPPAPPTPSNEDIRADPAPRRPFTDLGNAERLIDRHGPDVRYVVEAGKWATWQGDRWALDDTGEIDRMAKQTVRSIYREAADSPAGTLTVEVGKHAVRSEGVARIAAMIGLAQTEAGVAIHLQDFDANPFLLNCADGVIDLHSGQKRQHDRAELHMKCVRVSYHPDAAAPTWESFLAQVLPDEETRRFVQRAVGYSLTASTREQKFFLLYGGGSNGKSTFLEAIAALFADYAQSATMDTFAEKKNESAIPNDIARMVGARLISTVETKEGMHFNEALIKQLTGGDRITARFLHKEFFDFTPTHKLWVSVNHKPVIKGTDHAIWRRPVLIPFTVTIPEAKQDKNLPEKLHGELPGILAWAVRGCLEWQAHGLVIPKTVSDATNEYRAEMDSLAPFLDDKCLVHKTAMVATASLYEAYQNWCKANGEWYESSQAFGRRLSERGFVSGKRGGKRCWFGVALLGSEIQADMPLDDDDPPSEGSAN